MSSNKKIRVILVVWEISRRGGVQEVARQVAEAIRHSPIMSLKIWKFPKSGPLTHLARIWFKLKLDPQAVYFFIHPYLFEQFKKIWSRPVAPPAVVWAHGIDVWGAYAKARTTALPLAHRILASSQFTKDRLLENFPGLPISVAHMAAHLGPHFHFRPTIQPFEILTVGRLAGNERYKGHELVLEALVLLRQRGLQIPYHVIGTGDDLSRLQRKAAEMKIADQVSFHGFLNDHKTIQIFARCSVFVMPSHVIRRHKEPWSGEGLGLVYLEAASHGLPVIACHEGGQTDCVIDGKTGYLVHPHPQAIAERLEFLYHHREDCRKMGEEARRFVAENFNPGLFRKCILGAIREASLGPLQGISEITLTPSRT